MPQIGRLKGKVGGRKIGGGDVLAHQNDAKCVIFFPFFIRMRTRRQVKCMHFACLSPLILSRMGSGERYVCKVMGMDLTVLV